MNRRPLVACAVAAVAVSTTGLLSACGSGQIAQTAAVRPGVAGLNLQAPDGRRVYVRNVALQYPGPSGYAQGGNAPLELWIVNNTESTVTLDGVAAKDADVVESEGANTGSPCSVPRTVAPDVPPSPSSSPSTAASIVPSAAKSGAKPGASGTRSAPPSESPSQSPSPTALPSPTLGSSTIKVAVPAGGCVELTPTAANYLQIVGLSKAVGNADTEPMMFSFTSGDGTSFTLGSASDPVNVPVAVPDSPQPRGSAS